MQRTVVSRHDTHGTVHGQTQETHTSAHKYYSGKNARTRAHTETFGATKAAATAKYQTKQDAEYDQPELPVAKQPMFGWLHIDCDLGGWGNWNVSGVRDSLLELRVYPD